MISLLLALSGGTLVAPPSLAETLATPAAATLLQDEEPPKGWTGSVSVGGMLATGNSEQTGANAKADAELRRTNDRTTLGLTWVYNENSNNATNTSTLVDRKTLGKAQYDYFFSKKTYGLVQGLVESDFQAALDVRYNVGVGVGHQFREDETLKLGVEAGVSYIDEEYKTGQMNDYTALRAAYVLQYVMNPKWTLDQSTVFFPSLEDSDFYLIKVDTRLSAALTESMFAQVQHLFDYNNTPATGAQKDDNRFLVSVGWKF